MYDRKSYLLAGLAFVVIVALPNEQTKNEQVYKPIAA